MTPSPQTDTDQRLRPYVPELLLAWPPEATWQELQGTLVSADISGFTALSERLASKGKEGAEELSALICDCFDGMIEDCAGRGGDIIKFGGDALLVWFDGDHHAVRAASAAIAMRRTIRSERRTSDGRRVPLSVSIGLNSGAHHMIQIVGSVPDLLVTGPGATATVQAESDADAGMILVSSATAALLPPTWLGERHESGVVLTRRAPRAPDWSVPPVEPLRPVSLFVPPEQQESILAGIANEHRQVAVSFLAFGLADELIAAGRTDELAARLQQLTTAITEANERNGTYLLATDIAPGGGKFVIAAGAPKALGNNEDRLLRTIREVVDRDPGLDLHAGIHRGSLFAGDLGSPRRRVYTTLGDSMNLSARLSAKAGHGEIVVSRVTVEWSSVEFEVDPLPPFHVKGKGQAIHAGLLGANVGRRREAFTVDTALVGRRRELDELRGVIAAAAGGRTSAALITGEPGAGSTRLLAELALGDNRPRTIALRCSPLDALHGHAVIGELVRELVGRTLDDPVEDVVAELQRVGTDRFPRSVALLPLLAPVLGGIIEETPESELVPTELRATRSAQLLVQVITALVDEHTLVLVDDVEHADDTSRSVIETLCSAGLEIPLAVVVVGRPDTPVVGTTIELAPLAADEMAALVDELVGDADVGGDQLRAIVDRSGGNPMFASELVGAVLDGAQGVPDSLDAAIEIRLDRLEPGDRQVLRTAAVLGAEVDLVLLADLLPPGALADHDRWDRLGEFLERVGPGQVRFRYDAHRRVAYEGLPFRTRRALHRSVLELLGGDDGDPGRERLATLAHHAASSGDPELTWRYATMAARSTAELGLFGETAQLYRLAWGARRAAPPDELPAVAEAAADSFEVVGDFTAADEALVRVLSSSDDRIERARLLRKRGDLAERRGDYPMANRLYARAARELKQVSWASALAEQAQLDCARSGLALRQSRIDEAWRYGNLALGQAERVGDWATAAHAALMVDNLITQMSWAGVQVSRPDVLGLHQRAGDLLGAARWLSNQAVDRYYEGAWDDAVTMYRDSAEQCARFGHLASEATALNNIAEIASDRGQYDEASGLFRSARRSWRAIGFAVGVALVQANLGRLATRTGNHDDAIPLLADAIERFEQLSMPSMTGDARLRLIEDALLAGRPLLVGWWPADEDLVDDVVVQIYAQRLRAVEAFVEGDRARAASLADATVAAARDAGVPFDLALALRVRAAVTGNENDRAEIDAIHAHLGIVHAPPVLPG